MLATLADLFGDEILCAHIAQFPSLKIERDGRRYVVTSERTELPNGFCRFWFGHGFAVLEPRFNRAKFPGIARRIVAEFVTASEPLRFINARGAVSHEISSAERAARMSGSVNKPRRSGSADKSVRYQQ